MTWPITFWPFVKRFGDFQQYESTCEIGSDRTPVGGSSSVIKLFGELKVFTKNSTCEHLAQNQSITTPVLSAGATF